MNNQNVLQVELDQLPISDELRIFMRRNGFSNLNYLFEKSIWDLIHMKCGLSLLVELYEFSIQYNCLDSFKA